MKNIPHRNGSGRMTFGEQLATLTIMGTGPAFWVFVWWLAS